MATHDDDGEVFRRRVQQKLTEQYGQNLDNEASQSGDASKEADVPPLPPSKQSPYCIQNFIWLGFAIAVFYFSDFIRVVFYDLRINSLWFWIGVVFMGIHVSIAAFLVFWLSFWKKIGSDEWEKKYPKAVPLATASFIIGIICLTVGLWPVWGFLTPVILLVLFMGAVVVIAMIG